MYRSIIRLPQLIGQVYRAGHAFYALHQIRVGSRAGSAAKTDRAFQRLARALKVSDEAARDVYLGTFRPDYQAAFVVGANNTLKMAQKFARLAPATGFQVGMMAKEVGKVHAQAVTDTIRLSQGLIASNRRDTASIRSAYASGQKTLARALSDGRRFNVAQLSELTDELKILIS